MSQKRFPLDMSMEEYANTMHQDWGHWRDHREGPFYIYLSCGQRLRVQLEHHSQPGYGYDRQEQMEDNGVHSSQLDYAETAQHIVERMGDYFTLASMRSIVEAMKADLQKREDESRKAKEDYERIYGKGSIGP